MNLCRSFAYKRWRRFSICRIAEFLLGKLCHLSARMFFGTGRLQCAISKLPGLREQFAYQFAVDIRQSEVSALETEGEFLVIKAEQVEDGCMQIVDVYAVGN